MERSHVEVGPLPLSDLGPEHLVERVVECRLAGAMRPVTVFALHVAALNASNRPRFIESLRQADFVYPDGISVALLARLAGARHARKIATTDLAPMLIRELAECEGRKLRLAVIGGEPGVASAAAVELERTLPADVVVSEHGFQADWAESLAAVRRADPDLVLLGLGMPLEAEWTAKHLQALPPAVVVTCGGWLRILAGLERRAPLAIQRLQLEWAYRLLTDPRRVISRYVRGAGAFARLLPVVASQRLTRSGNPAPEAR